MEEWERIIAMSSSEKPEDILKRDRNIFKKLSKENSKLKENLRKLTKNNEKFVKLVEVMEEKIKKLTEDVKKNYVYSYEHGGWVEKGSLKKGKIKIAPSQLSVDSINNQLAEILRMIERHRIKE
ncbi:MAG: hypothetical protein JSV39_01225 [Candidatus Aenigmatarchaeota archaeon]|nr:MAG: hypothetical protein JSV39_01225 [Candidatus Aenigmarchaeota archaeon]